MIKQTIEQDNDTCKPADPGASETTEPTNKSYIPATNRTCLLVYPPTNEAFLHRPRRSPSLTKCAEGVSSSQEENSPIIAAWLTDRGRVILSGGNPKLPYLTQTNVTFCFGSLAYDRANEKTPIETASDKMSSKSTCK